MQLSQCMQIHQHIKGTRVKNVGTEKFSTYSHLSFQLSFLSIQNCRENRNCLLLHNKFFNILIMDAATESGRSGRVTILVEMEVKAAQISKVEVINLEAVEFVSK